MIQCPECGKEIADDNAHCGYCGATIETGAGKKTMVGFAAVTGESLRKAAEEAKAARKAAEEAGGAGDEASQPNLDVPSPGTSRPSSPPKPGGAPGKLSIPRPGSKQAEATPDAKTEAMGSIPSAGAAASGAGNLGPSDAGAATDGPAMPAKPDTAPEPAVSDVPAGPTAGGSPRDSVDTDIADTDPDGFEADLGSPAEPTSPPGTEPRTEPQAAASSDPFAAAPGQLGASPDPTLDESPGAEPTMPEVEPSHAGGGPTALESPGAEAAGPGDFGGGSAMQPAGNTLPEKKKNPLIIVGVIFAVLFALCCISGIALSLIGVF